MSKYTIQDIFDLYGEKYINKYNLSNEQWKVYNAIKTCKTKHLGIHTITCNNCGEEHIGFNSCRNRHCPMCQQYNKEKWINNESNYLLDCKYFHIVTTIPNELNELVLYNQKELYNILFSSTKESILTLGNDIKHLGAKLGITSILHTWGQTLEFHPHIHSIVTGGGLRNNKWISCKENYLFKVQILSSLFKKTFLGKLKHIHNDLILPNNLKHLKDEVKFNKFLEPLYNKQWITYIEPPKGNPENVIEYIGRYSFRVAISNERIKDINNGIVTFEYKDYKDNSKIKIMKLDALEFIRRFLMHVLPKNFTKIKHYGLLTNRSKLKNIKLCRYLLNQKTFTDFTTKIKRTLYKFKCPICECTKFSYNYCYKRS